jgi:serine/threonine-protein kinase
MRALRGIELTLFGLLLANQSWEFAFDLFRFPQFSGLGEWAGTSENNGSFLWFHSAYESLSFFILIVTYATLIPSDWRRCTLVVGVIAATPLVISAVACFSTAVSPSTLLSYHVLPMSIYLGIAVAIAAFGTHRVEALRRAAAEARELGQYRLTRRLGSGGMGEVYLAEHRLLKRPCAVKLIRPDKAADPQSLRRFEREVQATAALTHPNAIQVFDYGHTPDGTFYYAMEYLPGPTLEELVRRDGPLPPGRAVRLLRQVCGALAEAHRTGLVHRDVKPGNVIVCDRGGVADVAKLLDFGLVRDIQPGAAGETAAGAITGTPQYMAPEQASGKTVDARCDVYAVGGVAYFLLTGRPPFDGRTAMQMIAAHLCESPEPPSSHRHDLPSDLERAILRCLAKSPTDRFPDMETLDAASAGCDG